MNLEAFIQLVILWCNNTAIPPEVCMIKCRDLYEQKIVQMTSEKIFMECTKEKK